MTYWKYIIISLLGGMMLFHFAALFYIRHQRYELTSPDYYQREMNHESTLNALRRGQTLTWDLRVETHGNKITLQIHDTEGKPVHADPVTIHMYRPHRSAEDQTVLALPNSEGGYSSAITPLQAGRWNFSVTANLEGTLYAFQKRDSLR